SARHRGRARRFGHGEPSARDAAARCRRVGRRSRRGGTPLVRGGFRSRGDAGTVTAVRSSMRAGLALCVALVMLLVPVPAAGATLLAIYQLQPPASAPAGAPIQVPVTVSNAGTDTWNATGANPVDLSYHWTDLAGKAVVWDGARTPLGAD